MTRERLANIIRIFMRDGRTKRLNRRTTMALASLVVAWLPANYGAIGVAEWDDACRELTASGRYVTHKGCAYLDSDKPVVVTSDGYVFRVSSKGDVRLFLR